MDIADVVSGSTVQVDVAALYRVRRLWGLPRYRVLVRGHHFGSRIRELRAYTFAGLQARMERYRVAQSRMASYSAGPDPDWPPSRGLLPVALIGDGVGLGSGLVDPDHDQLLTQDQQLQVIDYQ